MTIATHRMPLWKVALLAFVAMCADDLAFTIMTVSEAHYQALMAGCFDVIGWLFGLVCSALAIESIIREGWRTKRSLIIIAAVSAANFFGTIAGVAVAVGFAHH